MSNLVHKIESQQSKIETSLNATVHPTKRMVIFSIVVLLGLSCLANFSRPSFRANFAKLFCQQNLVEKALSIGFFNKKEWDNSINADGSYHRKLAFAHFLISYSWRELHRAELNKLLGKASHRYIDSDIYCLNSGPCGNSYKDVEIHYDNDVMTKYRYRDLECCGSWNTAGNGGIH